MGDWIENGVFGANFELKQRAYYSYGRTEGKKARKLTLNCKIGYTYGKNLEQNSVLK